MRGRTSISVKWTAKSTALTIRSRARRTRKRSSRPTWWCTTTLSRKRMRTWTIQNRSLIWKSRRTCLRIAKLKLQRISRWGRACRVSRTRSTSADPTPMPCRPINWESWRWRIRVIKTISWTNWIWYQTTPSIRFWRRTRFTTCLTMFRHKCPSKPLPSLSWRALRSSSDLRDWVDSSRSKACSWIKSRRLSFKDNTSLSNR